MISSCRTAVLAVFSGLAVLASTFVTDSAAADETFPEYSLILGRQLGNSY